MLSVEQPLLVTKPKFFHIDDKCYYDTNNCHSVVTEVLRDN